MPGRLWSRLLSVFMALGVGACFEDATSSSDGGNESNDGGSTTTSSTDPSTGDGPGTASDDGPVDDESGDGADCPAGFTCAAAVPAGWLGPVARFTGSGGSLPSCAGDYPYLEADVHSGLVASPAACDPCACGEPEGVECEGPELRMFTSLNCNGSPALTFELGAHDECITFGEFGIDTDRMESDPVVPLPGSGVCETSGGSATLEEPAWTNDLRACGGAPAGGSCGDAGTCLPQPGNPFAAGLCIYAAGDEACPAGPYSLRNVYYEGFDDARGCSECGCNDPQGVDCQALVEVHNNSFCGNERATIDTPQAGTCYNIDGNGYAPRSGRMIVYGIEGGSCAPVGGEPVGDAAPAGATTLCCTQ